MSERKKIFLAVLNWGLGHATRCIPIIKQLKARNVEVVIGADGAALKLLRAEIDSCRFVELPAYNITYKTGNMIANVAPQVPKLLKAINKERKFIQNIVQREHFDAIISDNRFGIQSEKVFSVFMTHQLNIKVGAKLINWWVNYRNKKFIDQFDCTWVPDFSGNEKLAGDLSQQDDITDVVYIGPLSRMKNIALEKVYDIVVVLSGVEPARTFFEKKIIAQLKSTSYKVVIVGGNMSSKEKYEIRPEMQLINHLCTKELNRLMLSSNLIICRAGYSSIMDLVKMKINNALLIPTPGQTEQEYLAERLSAKGLFETTSQEAMDLQKMVPELMKKKQNDVSLNCDTHLLEKAIDDLLYKL